MAIAEKSGSAPFYKSGPLYAHGPDGTHPTDPTKEAKAKAEAKKKAEANASKSKKTYGKTTTKVENITTSSGNVRGTRTTTTKPYTQSGTGSAEFNTAYRAAKKAKLSTFDYGGKTIKVEDAASKSGKDVTSTVKLNKLKPITLKPMGIKITNMMPTANITIPEKSTPPATTPSTPPSLVSYSGKSFKFGVNKPKTDTRSKKTKAGGSEICGCK